MRYAIPATLAALLLAIPADAQRFRLRGGGGWGSGSCAVAQPDSEPVDFRPAPEWAWHPGSDPDENGLFRRGIHVGSYNAKLGIYRPVENGVWGAACAAPVEPPEALLVKAAKYKAAAAAKGIPGEMPGSDRALLIGGGSAPTGVDWTRIDPAEGEEHFHTKGGERISRRKAFELLQGAGIPDFKGKLRLTVIGSKADRDRVMADVKASPFASRVLAMDYDPADAKESWAVEPGFVKDGLQVYLQQPTGEVLARMTAWEGAASVDALRKADPNYKPSTDPDPSKPSPIISPALSDWLSSLPPWIFPAAAFAGVFALTPRRKEN